MLPLRPYQETDAARVREQMRLYQAVLLVEPTGAGKGFLCAYIIHNAIAKGKRVIFLVNRRTLVQDMSRRLTKLDINHGIYMGSEKSKPWLSVHVCSIDTLHRRENIPHADLVILDEAHFATSPTFRSVINKYPNAKILGLTATPIRVDGQGLGKAYGGIFDSMVVGPSVMDLIEQKFLVPSRVFSPGAPNTSGVKTTAGDFNQSQLATICDTNRLVGDIVQHWKTHSEHRKSVCFGVDQKHAQHIAEQFRCAGIDFAYVDAETKDKDRDQIWEDLDHGRLNGVSSVGVISYGWDHPIVSTVILARPTQSLGLHLQQIGRGSRPHPGKTDLLVLDHAGNTDRLDALYEDDREWSLEGHKKRAAGNSDTPVIRCRFCFGSFRGRREKCPYCGQPVPKQYRSMIVTAGELKQVQRERKMLAVGEWREKTSPAERIEKFREFQQIAKQRGYKPGWAYAKYLAIFGEKPAWERGI